MIRSILLSHFFIASLLAKPYVTTEVMGQLGNQIYQTAVAVAYALDHDGDARFPQLKRTINGELNCKHVFHRLNLSDFPEGTEFVDFYDLHYTNDYMYTPIVTNPEENIRFQGYFPNEKFFGHHSDYIKKLYAPSEEILDQIYAKYGELLEKPTVAVHIRTFFPDYIDPNDGVGRTDWQYYINAIECFPEDSVFLIFSDAPDWIRTYFPRIRPNMHFVEGNPHYIDFYLMSLCDHQVMSPKSTFSWWAAWFNDNPDKIVIAGDNVAGWMHDGGYPSSWKLVPLYRP